MTEDMTEGGGTAGGKRGKLRGCISVCTGCTEGVARCNEEQEEMKKAPKGKRWRTLIFRGLGKYPITV